MEDSCLPQDVLLSKMLSDGSHRTHSKTYNLQFWSAINPIRAGKTAELMVSYRWI